MPQWIEPACTTSQGVVGPASVSTERNGAICATTISSASSVLTNGLGLRSDGSMTIGPFRRANMKAQHGDGVESAWRGMRKYDARMGTHTYSSGAASGLQDGWRWRCGHGPLRLSRLARNALCSATDASFCGDQSAR